MKIEIVVDFSQLDKAIKDSLAKMRMKIIKALTEATIEAYVTAKSTVPVRTGLLRSSIHMEKISPFEHKVVAGSEVKAKGKPYYAPFVEFGTRKMSPRPYMRPAAEKAVEVLKQKL